MAIGEHLNALEATGLIHLAGVQPELEYVFRHALVQEAAYDSLLRQHRKQLHRAVGEALEELHADRRAGMAGVLAFHFENAEDFERALEYLLLAGHHARGRFAYREARAYFDRAEEHLPRGTSPGALRLRVSTRLARVESGYTFVPFDQNLGLAVASLPEAEALGDLRLLAQAHLLVARLRDGQGESYASSAALKHSLDEALDIGERLNDDSLRALPLAIIGRSVAMVDPPAATGWLEKAIPLLEKEGDLREASLSSSVLAMAYAKLGEFERAEALAAQALNWAEAVGDPNAVLDAELALGMVKAERGKVEEGVTLVRSSIARANRVGNTLCALVGNFYLGDYHLRLGQPRQALSALERSGELATYCDAFGLVNLSQAWVSTARSQLGDLGGAHAGWASALHEAERMGDRLTAGEIRRQRANALVDQPSPDWDRVTADYEESIRVFEDVGARPYLARALRDYGLALRARLGSDQAPVRETLQRAARLFHQLGIQAEVTALETAQR